jgi:hypothetical protein
VKSGSDGEVLVSEPSQVRDPIVSGPESGQGQDATGCGHQPTRQDDRIITSRKRDQNACEPKDDPSLRIERIEVALLSLSLNPNLLGDDVERPNSFRSHAHDRSSPH